MAGSGGPWGSGGGNQDDDGRDNKDEGRRGGPRRPGEGPQIPKSMNWSARGKSSCAS